MALNNIYLLEVDINRHVFTRVPKFRRGDNGIIIFTLFDDGQEVNIDSVTNAKLIHILPNGKVVESNCDFIQQNGKRAIKYKYEPHAMSAVGINNTVLIVSSPTEVLTFNSFPVVIYDDFKDIEAMTLEWIHELVENITTLDTSRFLQMSEKGVPNGVATLDKNGEILVEQLKSIGYLEALAHVDGRIYKKQLHGITVDENGVFKYEDENGNWTNVNK